MYRGRSPLENMLLHWLNADLLPCETSPVDRHGFFAEYFADGQLKHFSHYYQGSHSHSWCLDLEHAVESGIASFGLYSPDSPDYESFRNGMASMHNAWSDAEPPELIDYERWVVKWIRKIVSDQIQARARDQADEERHAKWSWTQSRVTAGTGRGRTASATTSTKSLPLASAVCPRCHDTNFCLFHALQLERDYYCLEHQIQLWMCGQCQLHGLAWLTVSTDGVETKSQHDGFAVSGNYWKSIVEWILACPKPNDQKCQCHSHTWLKIQGRFPELSSHADLFSIIVQ